MQETKNDASAKFNSSSYDTADGNLFKNTDENGMVECVLVCSDGSVWAYIPHIFEELRQAIIKSDDKSVVLEAKQESQSTVSEDFALKAMALVLNKESFGDLK